MRVKFYDHKYGARVGEIIEIRSARGMVAVKSPQSVDYAYPEQLRKLVKKVTKKPEIMYSFHADGTWRGIVHNESEVSTLKTRGSEVWLMRGVKKL
jgi:hypothetical protein